MQKEQIQGVISEGSVAHTFIDKSKNLLYRLSRQAKKFFRLFLWKMIYLSSQKNLKSMNEEYVFENLLVELKKPKLTETLAKGKKIFIHVPDGKDVHVKKDIIINK